MSLITKVRNYESFFDDKLKSKKPGTRKQYKYALKDFENFMKIKLNLNLDQTINEFKKSSSEEIIDTLQSWINQSNIELRNQRLRVTLVNKYLYYRGVKLDSRDTDDLEFQNLDAEERKPVTKNELRMLIANTKKPIRKGLYLSLLSSGMAIGEACHLKKSDLDLSQERIKIVIKPAYTKKSSRGRTVYISKEAWKILMPIYNNKNPEDFIFHDSNNPHSAKANEFLRLNQLTDTLNMADRYESQTRRVTLHSFRAYFATKAIQMNGENYQHKMLGHKGHLMEYDRYTEEKKLELYLKLEPELFIYEEKPQDKKLSALEDRFQKIEDMNATYEKIIEESKQKQDTYAQAIEILKENNKKIDQK